MSLNPTVIQLLEKAGRSKVLFRGNEDLPTLLPTYPEGLKEPEGKPGEYFWCPVRLLSQFHFRMPLEIIRRLKKGYI